MMRSVSASALLTALTTLVAAMALRAAEPILAVVAVAALTVLFAWYANLHSTTAQSGLGLANPAATVALAIVGRQPWPTVLPNIAAHAVGAVAGGLAALSLDNSLGESPVLVDPSLTVAATGAAVVGLVVGWAALGIDGGGPEIMAAVPVAVGGAIVPLGLFVVFHPATVVGLATAGLVPWDAALITALASLAAVAIGAYAVSLLVPRE